MISDLERLFRDSLHVQQNKRILSTSRQRLNVSTRVRGFIEQFDLFMQSKARGGTGLIPLSLRVMEGLHTQTVEEAAGDFLLNDILQVITEFHNGHEPFALRMDQNMMVAHIITSCLPLIYGDRLEANRARILRMLGTRDICESLLVVASRRVGKTTCIAIVAAALMICKPTLQCAIFAMVLKAAHRVMDAIKDFLDMHPRGRALVRTKNNTLSMVAYEEGLPMRKKSLEVYPATTNVRSSFLSRVVFFSS